MKSTRSQNHSGARSRIDAVDALRGLAVAQMVVFHFCFDLAYFGWLHSNFRTEPVWLIWRTIILGTFLFVSGFSVALRSEPQPLVTWPFWRRWLQVAAAALCVSAGSALMFPQSFIYFGVLHFVCVATIVAVLLRPLGLYNLALAGAILVAHFTLQFDAMNPKILNWIGLVRVKPFTEDYVPLVPWLAVLLVGLATGSVAQQRAQPLLATLPAPRMLVRLGVWSLTVYLIHQPIMIGLMMLIKSFN